MALEANAGQPFDAPQVDELLALLRAHGADVSDYRPTVLLRRAQARMARLTISSFRDYLAVLEDRPEELHSLARSVLVHHTTFFRDPEVFGALERQVLARATRPTRVWAIGVATGEEAYTLAMVLAELPETDRRGFEVLATDADRGCLETAIRGSYRLDALAHVPERYRHLLTRSETTFTPLKMIRDRVIFAVHDLRSPELAPVEAIVAHFDVVLCRNVLTYLDDRYRELALRRLSAVVRPGGALVVGRLESLPTARAHGFDPSSPLAAAFGILRRARSDGVARPAVGQE